MIDEEIREAERAGDSALAQRLRARAGRGGAIERPLLVPGVLATDRNYGRTCAVIAATEKRVLVAVRMKSTYKAKLEDGRTAKRHHYQLRWRPKSDVRADWHQPGGQALGLAVAAYRYVTRRATTFWGLVVGSRDVLLPGRRAPQPRVEGVHVMSRLEIIGFLTTLACLMALAALS